MKGKITEEERVLLILAREATDGWGRALGREHFNLVCWAITAVLLVITVVILVFKC